MLFITTCVCAVSVSAVDVLRQFMRVCVCVCVCAVSLSVSIFHFYISTIMMNFFGAFLYLFIICSAKPLSKRARCSNGRG